MVGFGTALLFGAALCCICSNAGLSNGHMLRQYQTSLSTATWLHSRSTLQVQFESCLSASSVKYVPQNTQGYETWRQRTFNSMFLTRFPKYYVLPQSEVDVRAAMKCLSNHNVPFVIRSGGHSYRGMSIIDCGAVIDLAALKTFEIDAASKQATVGAGWRLGPLYRMLWLNGQLVFPAGSCPSVGLSGLLTGGGHGILTRKLSVSVDNVVRARVVLSNGSIVETSETKNPDLYGAIRGGGGEYGVVTSWTLQTYAAPKVMTRIEIAYPWTTANVQNVMLKLIQAKPWNWPSAVSEIRLYLSKGAKNPLRLLILYWGRQVDLAAFINKTSFFSTTKPYNILHFSEEPYINQQLREAAFGDLNKTITLDAIKDAQVTRPWGAKTFVSAYGKGVLPSAGVQVLTDFVTKGCGDITITFLGGASKTPKHGPTGYDVHRNESFCIHFSSSCGTREAYIKSVQAKFAPYGTGTQYLGYIYDVPLNQDPFRLFFGNSAVRLKAVKAKYDSAGLMHALRLPACAK